jgi:nucleotide-binding universal stress UspA family protein
MYRHLLVPVDGGALSQHAIEASIALARKLDASITVLIVEPPAPPQAAHGAAGALERVQEHADAARAHAERVFESFGVQADRAGVPFDGCYARSTHIAEAIITADHERDCDLIVMATHVQGRIDELLAASNTKRVMARSRLPLLVLH